MPPDSNPDEYLRLHRRLKATVKRGKLGAALDAHTRAERLRRAFEAGRTLALFECLGLWQAEGLPFASLPEWAIEAWAEIGARFYGEGIEARIRGEKLPSLNRIAGIGGIPKRRGAWDAADHEGKARWLAAAYHAIVKEARNRKAPPYRYLCGDNAYQSLGGEVTVLNRRGEPTQEFLVGLAERFQISGNSYDAIYRRARRLLRLADK